MIHRNGGNQWQKSHIIKKYRNGTSIWQTTMSFENDQYSVDKDPYEWCLRKSKRLKPIDPQMNIQMRNHKLLTQMPGELEHAVKCRFNQNCALDNIQIPYNMVEFKDKPRESVSEVAKKRNSCHNCGSTDHYSNNCPKAKKKVYSIEKVLKEECSKEDSESESIGDAIREQSKDYQDPREELLVEYQVETPMEIQDIQLEAGVPQDIANTSLCKHTEDGKTFLVTPTKGMASINGTATKMTIFIYNSKHPLIIDSGAHCSIVARNYLDHHFQNLDKQLLQTKAKNFKRASGKITSIGTIIKEIIIPHRKEKLLNEFTEGQFDNTLTSKQNLSFLKILKKNIPEFANGEEPLGKIRGHDIESYLDVVRPYPPMLRRPPYPASLKTRKKIGKHINELLEMDVIGKRGHNEIVEITTPVLITWNDGKFRLCGNFRTLNNYTKADRYPIPRIPHALDKLEKAK
ncbi:hypothetical protein O181_076180 [Austropuccinia psidii MF-1]|uniref:CCHC-type domain-containing protein n=1 Tax=Austropuccinia psidii MF-1 TaxID=1389203 RepID=A0A9Q3FFR3_9BASI|nr:hypothetical protein [Austropuccinia psidii MF-1]